jgi:hypothetical protein
MLSAMPDCFAYQETDRTIFGKSAPPSNGFEKKAVLQAYT